MKTEFILSFGPTYRNYVLRFINHRILFHEHSASILELTMEKITPMQLQLNVFPNAVIEECEEVEEHSFTLLLYKDVYKQSKQYHDIKKDVKSIEIEPKLFRSALYGVRSNISDPSISSSSYDTLVCMLQDNE